MNVPPLRIRPVAHRFIHRISRPPPGWRAPLVPFGVGAKPMGYFYPNERTTRHRDGAHMSLNGISPVLGIPK